MSHCWSWYNSPLFIGPGVNWCCVVTVGSVSVELEVWIRVLRLGIWLEVWLEVVGLGIGGLEVIMRVGVGELGVVGLGIGN
jgi:hypothetical protein